MAKTRILITSLDVQKKESGPDNPACTREAEEPQEEAPGPLAPFYDKGIVAVGYVRVSTSHQDVAPQVKELREFAARRGFHWTGYYEDTGSGKDETRERLRQLLEAARRREFNILLVHKVDRLSRSVLHLLQTVRQLQASGIQLISVTEDVFDPSTPIGRAMLTLIGVLAELEANWRKERCEAGRRYAREHGTRSGKPMGNQPAEFNRERAVELFDKKKPDGSPYSYSEICVEVSRGYKRVVSMATLKRFYNEKGLRRYHKPGNGVGAIEREGEHVGRSE